MQTVALGGLLVDDALKLVREFFPKGPYFSWATDEEARRVFGLINDNPRKDVGYRR